MRVTARGSQTSLPEQAAIVSKIEELLSDLENGKQQLLIAQQQLKVYRQSLLKAAFEGKLTEEWRRSVMRSPPSLQNKTTPKVQGSRVRIPSKSHTEELMAAEPEVEYVPKVGIEPFVPGKGFEPPQPELPEGWKWVRLKDVCKIIGGVTKGKDLKGKTSVHLPYLRVANVQDGYLDLRVIKTIEVLPSDREKYRLLEGDVLYTEGGDKDKLGRGTIWKNEIAECIHQNHIFRARPLTTAINSSYLAYYSQTHLAKNYFFKHGKQTTNLASINLTILSELPVSICSIAEQKQIVDELESKLTVCVKIEETISTSLQQAETLKQSILKRAFEGKLI